MDDEWGLSMEELDSLEKNAKRKLAERQRPRLVSTSSSADSPVKSRVLPGTIFSSPSKSSGRQVAIKIFKDGPGKIALETQYNPHLVAALKTVPAHEWDQSRRVWTYPEDNLGELVGAVSSLSEVVTRIDVIPPLLVPKCQLQGLNGIGPGESRSPLKTQSTTSYSYGGMSEISPRQLRVQEFYGESPNTKRSLVIVVQIYLVNPDLIAARNPYHERIKEACQSVSGRSWNMEERVWTFPKRSLEELVQALSNIPSPPIAVEAIPPLALPESMVAKNAKNESDVHDQNIQIQLSQDSTGQKTLTRCSIKLLLHNSGYIAAKCEYHTQLVATLRTIPRAEWHAKERLWLFPFSSLADAERTLSSIDGLIVKVEHLEPLVMRALEASTTLPDLRGSYNNMAEELEKRLLPFQRDGVRFALQHGGRALIADEMGLGKTLQAIAFASCFKEDWPVLVIAPSSLRLHWAMTISQWLNISPIDIVVVMPQGGGSNHEGFSIMQSTGKQPVRLDGLFNIVSYDNVSKLQNEILNLNFKIIIADESHYMKNAQAKRTSACVPLLQKSKYTILLTGTPALSRPIELFKQLEALQPGIYRSVHEYGKRYCMGGPFGVYQGASNCDELHALTKSTLMIRRLKKDVLSELPQKRRQQIFLSLNDIGLKKMRALFHELEEIKRSIGISKSQEEIEKLRYSQRQLISKIYTDSAEVKIPAVQDYLSTVVEADCKFLIFAHHQTMLDAIEEFLVKKKTSYIRIDGSTPASSRLDLVNKFQDKDNVKAAVLGIRAAGMGLTLTAASMVIFAEMSWTPGELVQAEDRAHRIGQDSSVNVYYLHAHDTVDDLIWDTVRHKLENVGQVLDGKEDALHVVSAGRHHHPLPEGQSTIKSFLRPCKNPSVEELWANKKRKMYPAKGE